MDNAAAFVALLLAMSLRATPAFAAPVLAAPVEPACEELPCSVIRTCSSTGMACDPADRACTELARSKALEIKCEQPCTGGPRFVYCPADTGRADSGVVWILLGVALLLAVGGSALFWMLLRKKSA